MNFEGKWNMSPTGEIVEIVSVPDKSDCFNFIYQKDDKEIIDEVGIILLSDNRADFTKSIMFGRADIKIISEDKFHVVTMEGASAFDRNKSE